MHKLMNSITKFWSLMVILIAVLTFLGAAAPAMADDTNWTLAGAGDWFTANNWDHNVPDANKDAHVENGGTATIYSGSAAANSLWAGSFDNSSGTVTQGTPQDQALSSFSVNSLRLGLYSSGRGYYNLLLGASLFTQQVVVGDSGYGEFNQNGVSYNYSFHQVGQTLTLGQSVGGVGNYNLSGGTLQTNSTIVGDAGTGSFTQTGGTHTVATGLNLGQNTSGGNTGKGTYNLEGGGLVAGGENINNGEFVQKLGTTNTVEKWLMVRAITGGSATYTMEGGTLTTVGESIGNTGTSTFTQTGGTHTITGTTQGQGLAVGGAAPGYFYLEGGSLSFATLANLTMGFQGTGTFTQTGGEVTWGPSTNPNFNLLTLGQNGGTGFYNLQGDTVTSATLHMDGIEIVGGYQGTGTFIQTGGTNSIKMSVFNGSLDGGRLLVGNQGQSQGRYELSGGLLSIDGNEIVGGAGGQGTFMQTGGTNAITKILAGADGGRLNIGQSGNSTGSYTLNGGQLNVDGKEILGLNLGTGTSGGTGTFVQNGGTNIMTGTTVNDGAGRLVAGWYDKSVGTYTLNNGQFKADRIVLGDSDLTQQPDASGRGTLTINGGSLVVKQLYVGLAADQGKGGFGLLDLASQDAYVEVSKALTIGPTGIFNAVPGATIHMTGTDFVVTATDQKNLADLKNLKLIFTGGPKATDTFQVPFKVGSVEVGPDSHVQFVDTCNITNLILDPKAVLDFIDHDGNPGNEVITVDNLILKDIPDIRDLDPQDLNNIHYTNVSYITSPVPLPGAVWLLGTGLMGLGAVGWRRKRG